MNKKPYLGFIREFDSNAFIYIPKQKRMRKFEARSRVGILVGYARGNSYRVFLSKERRTVIARDVKIQEVIQHYFKDPNSLGEDVLPEHKYVEYFDENVEFRSPTLSSKSSSVFFLFMNS